MYVFVRNMAVDDVDRMIAINSSRGGLGPPFVSFMSASGASGLRGADGVFRGAIRLRL